MISTSASKPVSFSASLAPTVLPPTEVGGIPVFYFLLFKRFTTINKPEIANINSNPGITESKPDGLLIFSWCSPSGYDTKIT